MLQSKPIVIGIDLMGNENDPISILDALRTLVLPPEVQLVAIGLAEFQKSSPCPYVVADEFIGMDEEPLKALRRKKRASLPLGLQLLQEKTIDALISAGNTGALASGAKILLESIEKGVRPALLAFLPTPKKGVALLDVGAGVLATAAQLVQFAKMGTAYMKAKGTALPKVGLLNIGAEPIKGSVEHKIAYQMLQETQGKFSFIGNIEANQIFNEEIDVLVSDGFAGNVVLKTAEGIASLVFDHLEKKLSTSISPGALLMGVKGLVFKCHSYASPKILIQGIQGAIAAVKENLLARIEEELLS